MRDQDKTKAQLIKELRQLRRRVAESEASEPERASVEQALRDSMKHWHTTFDTIGDAIFLLDLEWRIMRCNKAVTKLTGRPFNEIIGRKCYQLMHHASEPIAECPILRLQKTHASEVSVLPIGERWFSITGNPVNNEDGDLIGAVHVLSDVTERKQTEGVLKQSLEEAAHSHRLLLALNKAAQAVQRAHTIEEVYRTIGDEIVRLGYEAVVFTLTDDQVHLALSHMTFKPTLVRAAGKLTGLSARAFQFPLTPGGLFKRAVTEGQPVFSKSTTRYIAEALPKPVRSLANRTAALLGLEEGILVPLRIGGVIGGLLIVCGRGLTKADIPTVTAFANQAAIAIENARLYQEVISERDKLAAIMSGMNDGVDVVARDYTVKFQNRLLIERFGDITGQLCYKNYMGLEEPCEICPMVKAIETGEPHSAQLVGKDDRDYEIVSLPLRNQDGTIDAIEIVRDVTERRRTEGALRQSEERFRSLVENAVIGFYRTTPDGRIVVANPTLVRMLGYSSFQELAQRDLEESGYEPRYPRSVFKQRIESEGEVIGLESAWQRKDGTILFVRESARAIRDEAGKAVRYEGTVEDITERKQAEEALGRSEERFRLLAENARDLIYRYRFTPKRGFEYVSPSSATITGYTPDEYYADADLAVKLVHPEDRPLLKKYFQGEAVFGEAIILRWTCKDGTLIWIEQRNAPVYDQAGNLVAIEGIARDITERKRAEDALKSAALETLEAVSAIVEAKDPYTAGHSAKVTEIALELAKKMKLGEDQMNILRITGPLHDLGKIGIPGSVLNKPTRLTQAEWVMIEAHPVMSAETASRVAAFQQAVPAIRHHHERWDGKGYPDKLAADKIPPLARIMAVADAFDAMTSERPYRAPRTEEQALAELEKGAGTQWDPAVVRVLLRIKKTTQRKATSPT